MGAVRRNRWTGDVLWIAGGVAAMALMGWWFVEVRKPADPAFSEELEIRRALEAGNDWVSRLTLGSPPERDMAAIEFMHSDLPRRDKISSLLECLSRLPPAKRAGILDLLATLQPLEAATDLVRMLEETRDPALAAKLLGTLRAATLATSSEQKINLTDEQSARAFEWIQKVFRLELARDDEDPLRFRAAVDAIPDVFPAAEGAQLFQKLADAMNAAKILGRPYPLTEAELDGCRLEHMVGTVDGRDFTMIDGFILNHPQALADERTKARILEQLSVTPIGPDESTGLAKVIDRLEPAEAPDDSYVRWLEVKSKLTGSPSDLAGLLKTSRPLRKAALIHFGDFDLRAVLGPDSLKALKSELDSAAEAEPDRERREFLNEAADGISLGVRGSGP